MKIINSLAKKMLKAPLAYSIVKLIGLFQNKSIRRAVWLPEFIKVKDSQVMLKSDTRIAKIADLHFLGWKNLKDYFSLTILRKLATTSKVIFDVGADTGMVSLYISEANPAARIYSFEPSRHSYPVLLTNLDKNNNQMITPNKMAVSSKNSTETFYYSPANSVISSLEPREGFEAENVTVTTIETFCAQNKINKIDLIKIDVEGFEGDVIAGMGEVIALSRPIIHAEVLNEKHGAKIAPVLPKDYVYFRIIEEKQLLQKDIKIDRTSTVSNNYLFVPQEKLSLLKELSVA